MAKRNNIIRIMLSEIEKGNIYLMKNGNAVSEEILEKDIQKDYFEGLKSGVVSGSVSFNDFKSEKLSNMIKLESVIEDMANAYGIVYNKTGMVEPDKEVVEKQSDVEMNPPETQENPPEDKPKRGVKARAADKKAVV